MMSYKYASAILGGTFDHLHIGHEKLITTTLEQSAQVTIGIVEKIFAENKAYPASIQNFEVRTSNLTTFIHKLSATERTTVVPIHDIYGTSLTDPDIQVIYVTEATKANAKIINAEREKVGLLPVIIQVIPYVLGDDGQIVSSMRIRAGEIDTLGHSYRLFFKSKPGYKLPASLRSELQKPIGQVLADGENISKSLTLQDTIITVGDVATLNLVKARLKPAVCVVDYHTRRRKIDPDIVKAYYPSASEKLTNSAGTISLGFADALHRALLKFQKTKVSELIEVVGEEDLLALPAILLAPLHAVVVYGQYDVGMVVVRVTEDEKELCKKLLEQF